MGQKVNPIGLRVGIIRSWKSIWFSKKDYADKLLQDLEVKKVVRKTLSNAGISDIIIERTAKKARVIIHAARPGMIIGKRGSDIEKLKSQLEKVCHCEISINIQEVKKPDIEARLVADNLAQQLEKRISFKKAAKRAIQTAMKMGAKGIKVQMSGRLNGAEIARTESFRDGRIPLQTLRADIDFEKSEAKTTYGIIGVQVWIYKGDVGLDADRESMFAVKNSQYAIKAES